MTRSLIAVAAAAGLAACVAASSQQLPAATATLVNPSFDLAGSGVPGWAQRGDEFGRGHIVTTPVASAPQALEMEVTSRRGASGNDSLMLYQVLDAASYRGQRVRFGAKVLTRGAAINLTLFTPERNANDFFQNLDSRQFVDRGGTLDVPGNATFLSFGIQAMGPNGAKAYVDDVFVTPERGTARAGAPAVPASTPGAAAQTTAAEVRIEAGTPNGSVNPLLFGMHLEWTDAGNGLVDARGSLRADVVRDLQAVRAPLFRFPGGIEADYYDWRAGAEPLRQRPMALNIFTNKTEVNMFGSAELVELLKATGADALITANYGTGTAEDAAAWARYLRDAGKPAKFWEIGNEIYLADPQTNQPNGRRIAKTGAVYAADFPRFRDAIRSVTPEARVGMIGHLESGAFPIAPATRRDWTPQMLGALKGTADFLSVHDAYAPVVIDDSIDFDDAPARARVYQALYAAPRQTADDLTAMFALLDRKEDTRGLPVAITEWGPLFGYSARPNVHNAYVDQSRTMAAAVFTASMIDTLLSEPRVLLAAYTNPIHRYYGGLLTNTANGLVVTPTFYVYSLYRNRFETKLVPVSVSGPVFDSPTVGLVKAQHDVPDIVARASVSTDRRRLTAVLVNRSLEVGTETHVLVHGFSAARADCQLLSASSANAINGPALTRSTVTAAKIEPHAVPCTAAPTMTLSMPPSSVMSIVMETAR